jgi:hypothetical protein
MNPTRANYCYDGDGGSAGVVCCCMVRYGQLRLLSLIVDVSIDLPHHSSVECPVNPETRRVMTIPRSLASNELVIISPANVIMIALLE